MKHFEIFMSRFLLKHMRSFFFDDMPKSSSQETGAEGESVVGGADWDDNGVIAEGTEWETIPGAVNECVCGTAT